eukprot:COSAG06_NODE_64077_length_260_cov_0.968944_1_plen_24_part_01
MIVTANVQDERGGNLRVRDASRRL